MTHWRYDLVRFACWLVLRIGFGLRVTGRGSVPRSGPFILASNHVSFLDPPAVGVACPRRVRFLARADLYQHPAMRAFLRGVEAIPVARGEADLEALRRALVALRAGEGVGIFPEGGRQFSGALGEAKRGVGLLAHGAKAPIIPVLVRGSFAALPPGSNRPHRSKIRVAFGAPIHYTKTPASSLSFPPGQSAGKALGEGRGARGRHERLAAAVTCAWRALEAQTAEQESQAST